MTAQKKSSIISGRVKFCVAIFAVGILSSGITAFVILGDGKADSDVVSLLFVQSSTSGTFEQKDGQNILTLVDVSPQTVYFSDRPNRITGSENTESFVALWSEGGDNSFVSNPPNAALEILDNNKQSDVFILELFNPVYDYKLETLQYTVEILAEASDGLTHYNDKNDSQIPATFENAVLFIDSVDFGHEMDIRYAELDEIEIREAELDAEMREMIIRKAEIRTEIREIELRDIELRDIELREAEIDTEMREIELRKVELDAEMREMIIRKGEEIVPPLGKYP